MEQIDIEKRLTTLEVGLAQVVTTVVKIEQLTLTVHSLAGDVKRLVADGCSMERRLKFVEEKPARRWDSIVMAALSSIVSLIVGAIGGALIILNTGG